MANVFTGAATVKGGDQTSAPTFVYEVTLIGPADYATGGTPFDPATYLPKGATLLGHPIVKAYTTTTGAPAPSLWDWDVTAGKLVAYVRTTGVEVGNGDTDQDLQTLKVLLFAH